MARKKFQYKLVGSIYYPYAVNLFQGEEFITIPGSPFEQLEDIDAFTMSFYRSEFSQHLPSRYQEKNHFSIRVFNNYQNSSYFIKTIFKDDLHGEDFPSLIPEIRQKTVLVEEKYKTLSLLPQNDLVYKYWKKIENALENREVDKLGQYFSENSSYYHKLVRYLSSGYDEGAGVRALEALKLEFRNYPIFRKVFVFENSSSYSDGHFLKPKVSSNSYSTPPMAEFPISDLEYLACLTHNFNTQGAKEEFLTSEEYSLCNPGCCDLGPQYVRKSKPSRKILRNSHEEN